MQKKLLIWELVGAAVVIALGFLLHNAYQWSGDMREVGLFTPVNQSVWEHLKLLFMPYVVFAMIEFIFLSHDFHSLLSSKAIGALVGMVFIVGAYYLYRIVFSKNIDWLNITIFIVGTLLACLVGWLLTARSIFPSMGAQVVGALIIAVIFVMFLQFSYHPPHSPIFRDPQSNFYGIGFES